MNSEKREAGRKGEKAAHAKHCSEHMREVGKRGGRPKLPTIEEIRQKRFAEKQSVKPDLDKLPNDLKTLKKVYESQRASQA